MAENKKSFILYCDLMHTVEGLDDSEAGQLLKHILRYVNDQNPCAESRLVSIAFEPIKQQLKRDLKKYEHIREQKVKAGLASANKRQQVSTGVESVEQNPTKPTVNVNDTVSDSVIVNEKKKKKVRVVAIKTPPSTTEYSLIVDFWLKDFHIGWTFGGVQGKAINSIIKKLKKVFPENDVVEIFKMMCLKLPEWYKDKDLSVIDSKLNEILSEIKNNQNEKKNIDSNGKPISQYDPSYQHD